MATIQISPEVGLVDEKLSIKISALYPGQQIRIIASIPIMGIASEATFIADENGSVDLSQQTPVSGSYDWPDPMGLIWTMKLEEAENAPALPQYGLEPFVITFAFLVAGQPVQIRSVTRHWTARRVKRAVLHEGDLRGVCFYPPGEGPFPAVIIVSGSGGGINETRAALFANHGYIALTLGYFAYEDRPRWLTEIPLEYFEQAARWLQAQKIVDANKLVITGGSRGGELSLLLGATFPFFKAVVANVPSSQVWSGFGGEDGFTKPAWLYKGKPVGFYVPKARAENYSRPATVVEAPIPLTPVFLESMQDEEYIKISTIPVENTKGPILLISGEDDQMWPSTYFSKRVMDRLKEHHLPYVYKHFSYPGAGHLIAAPYMPLTANHSIHPVDGKDYAFGGNPKDQAFANEDSWQQILAFLKENLK